MEAVSGVTGGVGQGDRALLRVTPVSYRTANRAPCDGRSMSRQDFFFLACLTQYWNSSA